jgi:outer membrane protein
VTDLTTGHIVASARQPIDSRTRPALNRHDDFPELRTPQCSRQRRRLESRLRPKQSTYIDTHIGNRGSPVALFCIFVLSCALCAKAIGSDGFANQEMGSPIAESLADVSTSSCTQPVSSPLDLFDAIERGLCISPKTRSAWAGIREAAATIGISKSEYLPAIGADVRYVYQHNETKALDTPQLESNYAKAINEESISLSWLLYDFGGRPASLRNSRELFIAAQANRDATLQEVFSRIASDYYAAQAAAARTIAKLHIETAARENVEAATARVTRGVAPITDQLQANTASAQATYERAKAEGDVRLSLGSLAVDLGLPPDEPLKLQDLDSGALPDSDFVNGIHDLIQEAKQAHPRVLEAMAQWRAAQANVHAVKAQGLPNVKIVGESDRSSQPVSASLGQPALPALTEENYIGLKIEVPLFDGFNRQNQIREAQAQADIKAQAVREAEQEVTVGVWSSVQTLRSDTENLRNTEIVLKSAREAFDAATHRYQMGVGNIVEVLTAQNALSTSEQQAIQAQLDWRMARLELAESLGKLGMWAIR